MNKNIFLLIAVIAITMASIPSLYSLFSGQHSFQNEVTCLKCHSDIQSELNSSSYHESFTCEYCHVRNKDVIEESGDAHGNVISPTCEYCHQNIKYDKDAHRPLILDSIKSTLNEASNEACISCHTSKSLEIKMLYADVYKLKAERYGGQEWKQEWKMSDYSKDIMTDEPLLIKYEGTGGQHTFPLISGLGCEKCHTRERGQLNNSKSHSNFLCGTCHQLSGDYHAANIPLCLSCHFYRDSGADAHSLFVTKANDSQVKNIACSSCHSNFNKTILFSRPSFIEWDVRDDNGTWLIENLSYGINKNIDNINLNGGIHIISRDANCVSCHDDIKKAVELGGHSNEQWKRKHSYKQYANMNNYCISCHRPITQNNDGQSPYPEYPFNAEAHGAIKISCIDCHTKTNLRVNINGGNRKPPYDSGKMGNIEISMSQQPYFVQSYLCIACKNTGNPRPDKNNSLHFKIYTEPEVKINKIIK